MKLYIPSNLIQSQVGLSQYLSNLGIESTSNIDEAGITGFVLAKIPEYSIPLRTMDELKSYVGKHKLNTANYLMEKFNKKGSHSINDKYVLHTGLVAAGLPTVPTIYPKSEQDIRDFITQYGSIFVKPTLSSSASDPWLSLNEYLLGVTNQILPTHFTDYLATFDIPSTDKHFYKGYTTFEEFASDVDVDEFIRIQNSPNSLPIHQCILQDDITKDNPTWNHIIVLGYVNGENQIIHDSYIIMPRTNDARPDLSSIGTTNNNNKSKVKFNFDSFSVSDIENMLNNRQSQGNDKYDMEGKLEKLFTQLDVRNTYFTAQGYINDKDEVIFFDLSSAKNFPALRRNWIGDDIQLNRMLFTYDLPHDVTKLHTDMYRFWFEIESPTGFTTAQLKQAAENKIRFMLPVSAGFARAPCTAYGDSALEVAQNVKKYLAICNTP